VWNGSAVADWDLVSGKVIGTLPPLPPADAIRQARIRLRLRCRRIRKTLYVALANRVLCGYPVRGRGMNWPAVFDTRLPVRRILVASRIQLALAKTAGNSMRQMQERIRLRSSHACLHAARRSRPMDLYPRNGAHRTRDELRHSTCGPAKAREQVRTIRAQRTVASAPGCQASPLILRRRCSTAPLRAWILANATQTTRADSRRWPATCRMPRRSTSVPGRQHPIRHVIYIIKENAPTIRSSRSAGGNNDPS